MGQMVLIGSGGASIDEAYILQMTLAPGLAGKIFKVEGDGTLRTGIVPDELVATMAVSLPYTRYTITCGDVIGTIITTGYFGIYPGYIPGEFSAYSWAQIAAIAEAGNAPELWKRGDEKPINFTDASNELVTLRIEDFGHDDLVSGGKAKMTLAFKNLLTNIYSMNSAGSSGGYKASLMRSTHIPAILAKFPADLQAAIKPVIKKGTTGGTSTTIQTTEESLWPLSVAELGLRTTAAGHKDEGEPYPLFVDNMSRIKRLSNGAGAASNYWTRSVSTDHTTSYLFINSSGLNDYNNAANTYGICLGFCI